MKRIFLRVLSVLLLISCSSEQDEAIEVEFFEHKDFELIFQNDPDGITMYFTGVRYEQDDFNKDNGQYRRDGLRVIDQIFNTPPFSEYREYFNAYIVYVNPEPGGDPFENAPEIVVRSMFPEFRETDVVLISANNPVNQIGIAAGVVASFPFNFRDVMIHEVGHVVGKVGDEYFSPASALVCGTLPVFAAEPNRDLTDDLSLVKWKHFIGLPGYEDIGAYLQGCPPPDATYIPTQTCVMNRGSQFCAPCRESIVQNILAVKGIEYDFQEFLLKDITD